MSLVFTQSNLVKNLVDRGKVKNVHRRERELSL